MEERTIARLVICLRNKLKSIIEHMIEWEDAEEKNISYWWYLKGAYNALRQAILEIRDSYGAPLGEIIRGGI